MNLAALQRAIRRTAVPDRDEHDLLALARLDHAALATALHMWESHAPKELKGLISGTQGWMWDAKIQTYRSQSGRVVRDDELKDVAETIIAALKKKAKNDLLLLMGSVIPILVWRHRTAADLSALYILMAGLATGKIMDPSLPVRRIILGHPSRPPGLLYTLNRLRVFTRKLEEDREHATVQQEAQGMPIEQRMGMYFDSARTIYEESRRQSHRDEAKVAGMKLEEKNILGDADHCRTTAGVVGCPEWSKRGWLPVGTMTPPGCRPCLTNCKCRLGFRIVPA